MVRNFTLPENHRFYLATMDWKLPFLSSLVYAIIVTYLSQQVIKGKQTSKNTVTLKSSAKPKSQPWNLFRVAVVAHNIFLCVFSGYVFLSVVPLLIDNFSTRPLFEAFCDIGGKCSSKGLGFWTWIFYLSKYYELLDTFILIAKDRPSSFLQTYHHAGAIISMWMLSSSRTFGGWVFVCFNSFIHTWMYLYYTLTCFGYQPRWKPLMTYMQIIQFLVGLPLAVIYVSTPGCHPLEAHPRDTLAKILGVGGFGSAVASFSFSFGYVSYLVVLFVDFARRAYFSKKSTSLKKKSE